MLYIMPEIPEISDSKLEELMKTIKPVVRFSGKITSRENRLLEDVEEDFYFIGDLYFIEEVDPRYVAFTWDPKITEKAERVNPNPYKTIRTIHDYDTSLHFMPKIAEVLAQIPEEDRERCVAFETNSDAGFTDGGSYHTAITSLYEAFPLSS